MKVVGTEVCEDDAAVDAGLGRLGCRIDSSGDGDLALFVPGTETGATRSGDGLLALFVPETESGATRSGAGLLLALFVPETESGATLHVGLVGPRRGSGGGTGVACRTLNRAARSASVGGGGGGGGCGC